MKVNIAAVLLLCPVIAYSACKPGYKPTDTPGVCIEVNQEEVAPTWVSDEKPPEGRMPSYQREGVTVVDAPNMATADAKADQEKVDAAASGRKAAGIR